MTLVLLASATIAVLGAGLAAAFLPGRAARASPRKHPGQAV